MPPQFSRALIAHHAGRHELAVPFRSHSSLAYHAQWNYNESPPLCFLGILDLLLVLLVRSIVHKFALVAKSLVAFVNVVEDRCA